MTWLINIAGNAAASRCGVLPHAQIPLEGNRYALQVLLLTTCAVQCGGSSL